MSQEAQITVVGLGAEGWTGLSDSAKEAIENASEILGYKRQLELLPEHTPPRRTWSNPLSAAVDQLVARSDGRICVLASGDPMLHGIGATIARRLAPEDIAAGRLRVIPHASALSLVCARLGWAEHDVELISVVNQPADAIARLLQPGRQIVVYGSYRDLASRLAYVLVSRGYGASPIAVLERLGAADEQLRTTLADAWGELENDTPASVAIRCVPESGALLLPTVPGLPDVAYQHDGALTKRQVRAATLAALAPAPDQLLWDIGAGSGSVGIEWLRAERSTRAIAIEAQGERTDRISANATALGVSERLSVRLGEAPAALDGLDAPDAVFIGGGLTSGTFEHAWAALSEGGRLVANVVTVEGEQLLLAKAEEHGGELIKLGVSRREPLGCFTAWRPALEVLQWAVIKQ